MLQTAETENSIGTAKILGLVSKTGIPLMASLLITGSPLGYIYCGVIAA